MGTLSVPWEEQCKTVAGIPGKQREELRYNGANGVLGVAMRKMSSWALALAAITLLPAQAATTIDDPVTFVRKVYDHWNTNANAPDDVYSARLKALITLDNREAHGEVGRGNDFNVWCNCQDGTLRNPNVTSQDVENAKGRKIVIAKFLLEGSKQEIHFYFETSKGSWKIDDVRSLGPDAWTYSLLLKYGFDSKQ